MASFRFLPVPHWAFTVVAVATVAVAGCGASGPLDGLGDASRGFAFGGATTTTTIPVLDAGTSGESLVAATDVLWLNDRLANEAVGSATAVVAGVWERREGSRFIQASRAEIATALPTLQFPALVPSETRWVTSQLVYDLDSGGLDADTAAAFGMWQVEPYTVTEGRLMVLRVGFAPADAGAERSDVTPIVVPDGLSLVWTEAGLRYEMFCRSNLSEELCGEVAVSFVPLGGLFNNG